MEVRRFMENPLGLLKGRAALVDLEMGIEIEGEGVDPEAHGPSADMPQIVGERAEVFMNERDYVGNLVYQGGVLDKILIDGGYINASDGSYHFFVTDRLGNVRVVANAGGGAEQVNHYDPYGASLSLAGVPDTSGNPYKWGGKEWDKTLYRYDFGARLYSPSDLRWRTMDPLCEKYYSLSPYAYCANNPMNLVDPSGMDWIFSLAEKTYLWNDYVSCAYNTPTGYEYVGHTDIDILNHSRIFHSLQRAEYLKAGKLFTSIDYTPPVIIEGFTNVQVYPNITYEADNIGPYNKLGRTFNGLSVSVVIGEKILSTEENIKGFYTVIAKYGGETKQILMSSLREPYITTPGTVLYGGSVNMPYQGGGVITNPLNVSVSGSWYQINPLGGNAAVSWTPFDTVNIIRSFVF